MKMKRMIFLALLVMLANSVSVMAVELADGDGFKPDMPGFVGYAPNRIVINVDPVTLRGLDKAALARGRTGIASLDHLGVRHGVVSIVPQFPGAGKTMSRGKAVDLGGWHKVNFSGNVDPLAVVDEYRAVPGVIDAEPVGIHRVSLTPNDPWYHQPGYQWHLPKIQAPNAWDIETGNPAITVAVLDTGVRYFHKDLGGSGASLSNPTAVEGNMWINLAEKHGTEGVDDDGPMDNPWQRRYVDDWIGWDFVNDPCGPPGAFLCYPCCCFNGEDCLDPDNDPRDFHGHGTHCAGNVSAINNNEFATASPAGGWGSWYTPPYGNGVKVMALRIGWKAIYVLFEVGLVAMDYAAEALYYAANNGAKIASCSWGSDGSGGIGAAIDYFVGKGGLIFKAAGNDGTETADYMCSRDDVICVAATDQGDCKASFSTYGTWVDISAPGVQVGSLWHQYTDPVNDYVIRLDGTSMATPLAASVAALIWSRSPGLSADGVKDILFASADPIDGLLCNSSIAGKLGAGRINAYQAVLAAGTPPPPVADFSGSPTGGNAPLDVAFADQSTGSVTSWSWTFGDGGTSTAQNPSHTYVAAGSYTVALAVAGPGGSDTVTKAGYITVASPGNLASVTNLVTGLYTGRGKTRTFQPWASFVQGDEVVFRAQVQGAGGPLPNAVVTIGLSGPEAGTLTSGPSDSDGIAEARWKTSAPKGKNSGSGTPKGTYAATVTGVTADGHAWDGVPKTVYFSIN